jgi:hypothetical protein
MEITTTYWKRFEAVGLEIIRREFALGSFGPYLGQGTEERTAAAEWVKEQEKLVTERKLAIEQLDAGRYRAIKSWTVVAAIGGVIAAVAGIIAAVAAVFALKN